MNYDHFLVPPHGNISLRKDYDPGFIGHFHKKSEVAGQLEAGVKQLAAYQDILYAQNTYAVLILFQAMDAAGKDSTIKHVMSGVNPQGCQVSSFKAPSAEELDHDYLWRAMKCLPERGRIGIFNRSYYEETLVVRVHPELLEHQQLPPKFKNKQIWQQRFEQINHFEKYLVENGIVIVKFFLNISKGEQKKRFLERINRPEKNWKFSASDIQERAFWDDYMHCYEEVFNYTSTKWAPWHIIPADHKWYTRLVVADIIDHTLQSLNLTYPTVSQEHRQHLQAAKTVLEQED
ncbi:MAG: polyphosphate kinase 2 family protein [Acaryochloris sp. RU_4_1]|nr:polyphosphate kinase 2 family protein [Acaryochloris sp. SU_5_25]NJM64748.1 polyphosphate kinase 2 family protein [Acaryochloris sp. RU_4_1]NJN37844.1 polyphosphate kinase 2 family protein [Acaryochloridaceae cyanobacterium CSU_3_4]NJR53966.1 polyphosphate kinase 2 family protein [Acaryochloris sp. CRU_2_0]